MAELTYPLSSLYPVTRPFGDRSLSVVNHLQIGPHTGIDLGAPTGTPVLAAGSGIVTRAGWVDAFGGRMVYLVHDAGGLETRYAHLGSTSVVAGQHVSAGQQLGTSDTSGAATGPHLHFEVIAHGAASCGLVAQGGLCFEDPAPYIGVGAGATPAGVGSTAPSRPKQVFVPHGAPCPPDYHLLPNPSIGNPAGTDVCELPSNLLQQATDNPLSILLPPLLEPAIAIGVILAGGVLIYQGFREVLAG